MGYNEDAIALHKKFKGKLEIVSKVPLKTRKDLSLAYTPGVAAPCLEIAKVPEKVYDYTAKSNMIAVVSDGSAVLGLGNIGAKAAIPVMEGKCILFKEFGDVNAIPICLETQEVDEIVKIVKNISPTLGGINLEDISAPRCFEVERKLQELVDIPVFHDDQHGTAIVVCAGLINALKLANKKIENVKIVINGAGAAGTAIAHMLMSIGAKDIIVCNSKGILTKEHTNYEIASITNHRNISGTLADAMMDTDVFIGVSAADTLTQAMVKTMSDKAIIFAMANPNPEILPHLALEAGAFVVGTGRSDFNNQVNNVLAFPGIFKGALRARAKRITESMKLAAVYAIADIVSEKELTPEYVIPSIFHPEVSEKVAAAVEKAWHNEN